MVLDSLAKSRSVSCHPCQECGDLGLVAKTSRMTQRTMFTPQPLTCAKLLDQFREIAKVSWALAECLWTVRVATMVRGSIHLLSGLACCRKAEVQVLKRRSCA